MLLLDFSRALDEGADEDFGVAVYGCYDRGWDGLRECVVSDLGFGRWLVCLNEWMRDGRLRGGRMKKAELWRVRFTFLTVSFRSFTRRNML